MQIDRRQRKLIDEASFRALRGFAPASMPDFLALTGDTADGIPGLTGFGEKGAGMLLGAYPHLEDIPRHAYQWSVKPRGALQLAETLAAHLPEALLYRQLATLVDRRPGVGHAGGDAVPRGAPAAVRGLVRGAGREHAARRSAPLGLYYRLTLTQVTAHGW